MATTSSQPLTVSLSGSVAEFVRAQVAAEGFLDASDYVNRLVSERQRQRALAPLESLLIEGLNSPDVEAAVARFESDIVAGVNSGPGVEATDEFWADVDRKVEAKLARPKSS